MENEIKACVNCIHCRNFGFDDLPIWVCANPKYQQTEIDFVTGKTNIFNSRCDSLRESGQCGHKGHGWEEKPPKPHSDPPTLRQAVKSMFSALRLW